jgi:uncharacterized membrane protein
MSSFMLFLHLLGSIGMGFYLLLPFLTARIGSLSGASQQGYAGALKAANRIGQILLVVQLLTGGYMVGKGDYSAGWMAAAIILLVLIGAMSGMMGGPLKRLTAGGQASDARKVNTFALINAILFLAVIILMYNPTWL